MADLFKSMNCWQRGDLSGTESPPVPIYCRGAGRGVGRGRQAVKVAAAKPGNSCIGIELAASCSEKAIFPQNISADDGSNRSMRHQVAFDAETDGRPLTSGVALIHPSLDNRADGPDSFQKHSSTVFQRDMKSVGAVSCPVPESAREADCSLAGGVPASLLSRGWNPEPSGTAGPSLEDFQDAPETSGHVAAVTADFTAAQSTVVDCFTSSVSLPPSSPDVPLPRTPIITSSASSLLPRADLAEFDLEQPSGPDSNLEPTMANVLAHTFSLLSMRPGTFSGVMPALVQILKINVKEESDLDEVIDKLCFASIKDENFRYNGVRICTHLAKEFESLHFLDKLLARCRAEYNLGFSSLWFCEGQNSYGRVALFIGELMVQMKAELGSPSEILIQFVLRFLDHFLASGNDSMFKFLVQLLKLTGIRLHACVKDRFDEMMVEVKRVILLETTSSYSRELLLSLLLKQSHDLTAEDQLTSTDGETESSGATDAVPVQFQELDNKNCDVECIQVLSLLRTEDEEGETPLLINEEHVPDCSLSNEELNKLLELLTEEERKILEIADDYEEFLRESQKK